MQKSIVQDIPRNPVVRRLKSINIDMNAKSTSLLTHAPKHLGVVLLLLLHYQNLCLAGGGSGGGATPRIVGGGKARRGDYPFFGESLEESFVWTSQSSLRTLFYVVNIYIFCFVLTYDVENSQIWSMRGYIGSF